MRSCAALRRHTGSARAGMGSAGAASVSQGCAGGPGGAVGGTGGAPARVPDGGCIGTLRRLSIQPCTSAKKCAAASRNVVPAATRAAIEAVFIAEW